jgi:DNA transformation protein
MYIMKVSETTPKLVDLPNIGPTLGDLFREAGINTPDELYENGTFQTFIRIKAVNSGACLSKLCVLEGAIEGIRCHKLSKEKKAELRQLLKMINK